MPVETNLFPPRYRGPRLIGHGGMGDIYRATDDMLGRPVAIKVLAERYADDESVRVRFTREALAAARLSSEPNTVTIFDVGEWNDRPFIVMAYLGGGSLEQRLREDGAQPPGRVLRWLEQVARALDAAHAQGVVHRDVKPGNLLLDPDGNVHVADFGIATAAGLDSLTQTGTIIGTAGYLSPEQAQGERAAPASDVYALGVVAFELLTGERPYESDSATAEAAAHVHAPIPSVSEENPALPRELDAVFERVLAKDPGDRFESGSDFVAALSRALEPATEAIPPPASAGTSAPTAPLRRSGRPSGPLRPSRPARRGVPLLPVLAALLLLLGATGAVLAALLTDDSGSARERTFVTTVREQGTTVRETVTTTTEAPPTSPPAAPPPPPAASEPSGAQLNDAGFAKMQAGDYEGALPLLEEAVPKLQGTGSTTEAYASYNLAFTRFALGNCDGVLELLDRSEAIQGRRKEIDRLRKSAGRRCG